MSEEDKLKELWKLLAIINLDFNWVLALASLTAQEIAVKRKLNELGVDASGEDFQKWADKLSETMKNNGDEPPEILISIARAYRHIRVKLVHDPNPKVNEREAEAIFNNTIALIDSLFINEPSQIDVDEFISSINATSLDEKVSKFIAFNDSHKKQIFKGIMNRLALSTWTEDYKYIFNFMQLSLNKLIDKPVLRNLLEIVIRKARNIRLADDEEKLLSIILNFLKLDDDIKEFIKEKGLVDVLLEEYGRSWSFNVARLNAEIISEINELLTPKEINRVAEVALSNDQIRYSWKARSHLEFILNKYKDVIPKEKADKLAQVLKNE